MAYEALYRRYRPRRFDEVQGQPHIVAALRNAVRDDRVGHAYLFSGPRGTGKTTSARLLGKALNCTDLGDDGEPCNECDSCVSFLAGNSYDLHELDAASNNGVEAMRDLISKVALGSPGRSKVYILDEVHMLSSGAENALLKTLEEPPPHVVFVLATTEPNKVVPTIRSRTQHLEFKLLPAEDLDNLVREVSADAGLEVSDADIEFVVRAGSGSARDTLSALDQVVAAGGAPDDSDYISELVEALAARDAGRALVAVNEATTAGRDPAVIGGALLAELRNSFLAAMQADLSHLADADRTRALDRAGHFGPAVITRGIELVGAALVDMRQAPDPRVDLEVALVRLTRPEADTDAAALAARIERLEQGAPAGGPASPLVAAAPGPAADAPPADAPPADAVAAPPAAPPSAAVAPVPAVETAPPAQSVATPDPSPPSPGAAPAPAAKKARPADVARAALAKKNASIAAADAPAAPAPTGTTHTKPTLGAMRRAQTEPAAAAPSDPAAVAPSPAPAPAAPAATVPESPAGAPAPAAGGVPSHHDLQQRWDTDVLASLPGRVKSKFSAGHFLPSEPGTAVFALPNAVHAERCEEVRAEVDAALAAAFGAPVPLRLGVDSGERDIAAEYAPPSDEAAPAPAATAPAAAPPAPFDEPAAPVAAPAAPVDEPVADKSVADDDEDEIIDVSQLEDANDVANSTVDRLLEAFEGAEIVDPPDDKT